MNERMHVGNIGISTSIFQFHPLMFAAPAQILTWQKGDRAKSHSWLRELPMLITGYGVESPSGTSSIIREFTRLPDLSNLRRRGELQSTRRGAWDLPWTFF
jgi:hypothetical protein